VGVPGLQGTDNEELENF
jgi:hypothetical protein